MTTYTTEQNTAKKPYDSPRLVVYGDVREITQQRRTGPNDDKGAVGFNLT